MTNLTPSEAEGQFFLVEHDSGYEVETTLHAAMERRAEFGGRIWSLTGSIVKPQTDTYRQIENDGWIEWGGGECPIELPRQEVEYLTRLGNKHITPAGDLRWYHEGKGGDIIAYRVIENDGREG